MASSKKGAAKSGKTFRVGKVRGDLRGSIWYLTYHEHGSRKRPRVGPDRDMARRMAAQIHAQLENSVPAALSFEPLKIAELRSRWLDHHEHVARSSVQTIRRYRAATQHLLTFLSGARAPQTTAHFGVKHAEAFVRHLRSIRVPPNGHPHATPRPLLDKGVQFILATCRALFSFGMRRRHLPPYAENPFAVLQLDRMPIEQAKPILLFGAEQERSFLEACDDWQFPLFLTLMLTGMRPGAIFRVASGCRRAASPRGCSVRSSPGSTTIRATSTSSARRTTSPNCRWSSPGRNASTGCSSSTCPDLKNAGRSGSSIWQLYLAQLELEPTQRLPDDTNWTGAEIRACCRLAAQSDRQWHTFHSLSLKSSVAPGARRPNSVVRIGRRSCVTTVKKNILPS